MAKVTLPEPGICANGSGSPAILEDEASSHSKSTLAEVFEDPAYAKTFAECPELRELTGYSHPEDLLELHEDRSLGFILKLAVLARKSIDEAVATATQDLIQENAFLKHQLSLVDRDRIFAEVVEGLTLSEKARFANITEHIVYADDPVSFKEILTRLRDQNFARRTIPGRTGILAVDDENQFDEVRPASPEMRAYAEALKRLA